MGLDRDQGIMSILARGLRTREDRCRELLRNQVAGGAIITRRPAQINVQQGKPG